MKTRPAPDVRNAPWFDREGYPFESHYFDLGEGRMHYLDEGHGPPVVLVHGTPSWSYDFRKIVAGLRDRYRCIVPDHLGFGLSDRPVERGLEVVEHTAHLGRLLEALGVDEHVLVVHDFGGPIALPLALAHPERIRGLAVLNSWFWSMDIDPAFAKAKRIAGSAAMRFLYLHANLSARVMVKGSWGTHAPLNRRSHHHFTGLFPDGPARLGTWAFAKSLVDDRAVSVESTLALSRLASMPSVLIWGQEDRFVGAPHLDRWRQELPQARVAVLPHVGHFPQDEAAELALPELEALLDRAA